MSKAVKLLEKLSNSQSDGNWKIDEIVKLLKKLGFSETDTKSGKKSGTSHRKFSKEGVTDLINLQEGSDGKAKRYQVNQVRDIVTKHNLKL